MHNLTGPNLCSILNQYTSSKLVFIHRWSSSPYQQSPLFDDVQNMGCDRAACSTFSKRQQQYQHRHITDNRKQHRHLTDIIFIPYFPYQYKLSIYQISPFLDISKKNQTDLGCNTGQQEKSVAQVNIRVQTAIVGKR